jgi:hypothetical protein
MGRSMLRPYKDPKGSAELGIKLRQYKDSHVDAQEFYAAKRASQEAGDVAGDLRFFVAGEDGDAHCALWRGDDL